MFLDLVNYSRQVQELLNGYESDYKKRWNSDLPVLLRHSLGVGVGEASDYPNSYKVGVFCSILKEKKGIDVSSSWPQGITFPQSMYQIASDLVDVLDSYVFIGSSGTLSGGTMKLAPYSDYMWRLDIEFTATVAIKP